VEFDEFWEGIVFTYPVDQKVVFKFFGEELTGKVLGQTPDKGVYIVLLDQQMPDTKALLVHEDDMRLLTCNWCRDTRQVAVTPLTGEQIESGNIPMKPCPEKCHPENVEVVNG
jgi:hypothetical protein